MIRVLKRVWARRADACPAPAVRVRRWLTSGLIPGLMLLVLCACRSGAPQIRVEDAWVRITLDRGAAYMVIVNEGQVADVLVGAESPVAGSLSLHKTVMKEGGVVGMEPVSRLEVPAGARVELKPLSLHLMMTEVQGNLVPGQKVLITLQFEKFGQVEVEAEVRQP